MIRSAFVFRACVGALMLTAGLLGSSAQAQVADKDSLGASVRVVLVDGTTHVGTIESLTDASVEIEAAGGVRLTIPRERIAHIQSLDGAKFHKEDPNRSRLLFAATARPVPHGSGYVAVYEVFFPFAAVGVRDVLTLAGGMSLIPGVGIGEQVFYVAPKITVLSKRELSIGVGSIAGTTISGDGGGIVFGLGTYGPSEAAITLGAGFGFVESEFSTRPVFLVAGEYQISNSVKLLSENYIIPAYADAILASVGVRFFGERLAADLGMFTLPTLLDEADGFPFLPWLGFAYNFGQGR